MNTARPAHMAASPFLCANFANAFSMRSKARAPKRGHANEDAKAIAVMPHSITRRDWLGVESLGKLHRGSVQRLSIESAQKS